MSVFDLDQKGKRNLDEQAQLGMIDASQLPPPAWAGFGESSKSLMGASAQAGRTLAMVGAVAPLGWDAISGMVTGKDSSTASDWWFKHAVDGVGTDAVEAWTPDASQMGSASQTMSSVFHITGTIPQMFGTPELFLANSAFNPATDLVRRNVDARTALGVGGVSLLVNAAGFKLPATFGTNLATRIGTGVGANVALGAGYDKATSEILNSQGYSALAGNYDWANMKSRGVDAAMGLMFGVHGHLEAKSRDAALDRMQAKYGLTRKDMADALMTHMNGEHFVDSSMPGDPTSIGAVGRGQKALSKAITQILHGDDVNVSDMIHPGDFLPKPQAGVSGYIAYRRALESGGNPEAANPKSTALGIDQFTEKTWIKTVAQAQPEWAKGMSRDQLLAARTDPVKSGQMAAVLDADNARSLMQAGVQVNNHTLYAAHHFGAGKAIAFAKAAEDTPIAKILSRRQVNANPYLKGKTKAQVLANWDARAQGRTYTANAAPRDAGESDKAYAKRVIDQLPDPASAMLPDDPTNYFETTGASMIPVDALHSSKTDAQNAKGGGTGLKRMAAAREGVLGKRAPLDVHENGDGTYTVLDGNGTLTAARKLGWDKLPTRVVSATADHAGLQERYNEASKVLPQFTDTVKAIAHDVGGEAMVPGLKGAERATAKVHGDYGGDASRVKDLVRGTIVVNDLKSVDDVLSRLREKYGEPIKLKNHLNPDEPAPYANGYRDLNSAWEIDGTPVELQVHVPEMVAAKEGPGHDYYVKQSELERKIASENRRPTEQENALLDELDRKQNAIYTAAWDAATARMNSDSGISSASSRKRGADLITGEPVDQSSATWSGSKNDQGSPSTSPNLVPGENLGTPFIERADMGKTSTSSIPEKQGDNTAVTQAMDVLKTNPDLQITLDDGQTVSASDALVQADAEISQADNDAKGFQAAANCAMRYNDAL